MTYGIELHSSLPGEPLQIISGLPTYTVLERQVVTTWLTTGEDRQFSQVIQFANGGYPEPPLIAQRPSEGLAYRAQVLSANSAGMYTHAYVYTTSDDNTLELLIIGSSYATAQTLDSTAGTYGIEVSDDAGNVTYDSRWLNQVSVVAAIPYPDLGIITSVNTPTSTPQDFPLGRDVPGVWLLLSTTFGFKSFNTQGVRFIFTTGASQLNDNTIRTQGVRLRTTVGAGPDEQAYGGTLFVLRINE